MELYHQIVATWSGSVEPGASCMLKVSIDIGQIKMMLRRFDLFTITHITTTHDKQNSASGETVQYEYTKLHRNVVGDTIQYTVTVYGDPDTITIQSSTTKGYYVCKEG